MTYNYLLDLALILLSTKVLGLLVKRFQMPQVVGALLAGLILGPAVFDILQETDFIAKMAELGVIVIMFTAGMDTNIRELKQTGKSGFIVALLGVLIPLIMGTGLMYLFNKGESENVLLQNVFIGIVLTATSVSITVETLKELGKLSTKVGNTILAASLIDDILGLIALTIVTSMVGSEVSIIGVLIKIVLFFVFAAIAGYLFYRILKWCTNQVDDKNLHRFPIAAFVICLIMAYSAEHFFGVADIIGAFIAGLVIANTSKSKYIASKFNPLSYLLLSPIFFASIGIKVIIPSMDWTFVLFSILLILVAIFSKLIGCGIGGKFCGFNNKESMQVGFGMACRGEVALIVANKGVAMGLMDEKYFGPVIVMVVFAAIFTPIILKIVFKSKDDFKDDFHQSDLIDSYDKVGKMDKLQHKLLDTQKIKLNN